MERTLKRELRLSEEEVIEAVKYWLVNTHDIQIGKNTWVEFENILHECRVISTEEAEIELTKDED